MKAMILAAGRGERMGDLTANTPKPLLKIKGSYLIEYSLAAIRRAGILEVVINISWQAEQIKKALGNGDHYGVKIAYSEEAQRLETGGGIFKALPLLGSKAFLVVSCDIISDFPLHELPRQPAGLAHIIMVKNPYYRPEGDYGLKDGKVVLPANQKYTHGNIGIYSPELFANCAPEHFRLTKVLNPAISQDKVSGELYQGLWHNIGTPEEMTRAREDSNLRPLASETNTLSS